jgi:ribose transport system permease protein
MNTSQLTGQDVGAAVDTRTSSKIDTETITTVILLAATVVLIVGSRLISPSLGSWGQVLTILTLGSFLLVASFGQGLVITTGGLDLSIPGTFMLGGVLSASWIGSHDVHVWFYMPVILLIGGLVGAVNGLGVTKPSVNMQATVEACLFIHQSCQS